jgi:hypothetical protein
LPSIVGWGIPAADELELKTKSGTKSTAALMAAIRTKRNLDTMILLEMNGEGGYDDWGSRELK